MVIFVVLKRLSKVHLILPLGLYRLDKPRVKTHFSAELLQTKVGAKLFLEMKRLVLGQKHSVLESNFL